MYPKGPSLTNGRTITFPDTSLHFLVPRAVTRSPPLHSHILSLVLRPLPPGKAGGTEHDQQHHHKDPSRDMRHGHDLESCSRDRARSRRLDGELSDGDLVPLGWRGDQVVDGCRCIDPVQLLGLGALDLHLLAQKARILPDLIVVDLQA